MLTWLQVPYTPTPSTPGVDQATAERLERIENVLSAVVRHNPGIGGYDAVREWLACECGGWGLGHADSPSQYISAICWQHGVNASVASHPVDLY